jgi:Fur family transcriptional regulator, iron response regulator
MHRGNRHSLCRNCKAKVRALSIIGCPRRQSIPAAKGRGKGSSGGGSSVYSGSVLVAKNLHLTAFLLIFRDDSAERPTAVPDVEMSFDASILNDDAAGTRDGGRQPALTGCPWHDVNEMLQTAGLRPTRQRMALGWLLFGKGARHLTAEMLYEEATLAKVPVSLATVYNTLNQLTDAGLLRQVSVDGTKTYFDTNVSAHHHFYLEHKHELVDIPDPHLVLQKMPEVPEGYEIARVDMVVRLRKKR